MFVILSPELFVILSPEMFVILSPIEVMSFTSTHYFTKQSMRTKILYECQKSGLHVTLGWGEMSVLSGLTTFSWSLACMRMIESQCTCLV